MPAVSAFVRVCALFLYLCFPEILSAMAVTRKIPKASARLTSGSVDTHTHTTVGQDSQCTCDEESSPPSSHLCSPSLSFNTAQVKPRSFQNKIPGSSSLMASRLGSFCKIGDCKISHCIGHVDVSFKREILSLAES